MFSLDQLQGLTKSVQTQKQHTWQWVLWWSVCLKIALHLLGLSQRRSASKQRKHDKSRPKSHQSNRSEKENGIQTPPVECHENSQHTKTLRRYGHFGEFPTPQLLRQANLEYAIKNKRKSAPKDHQGHVAPYPTASVKRDIFSLEKYSKLDTHAIEVSKSRSIVLECTMLILLVEHSHNLHNTHILFRLHWST